MDTKMVKTEKKNEVPGIKQNSGPVLAAMSYSEMYFLNKSKRLNPKKQ